MTQTAQTVGITALRAHRGVSPRLSVRDRKVIYIVAFRILKVNKRLKFLRFDGRMKQMRRSFVKGA